ncbi:hypothetical protein EYF80_062126 [Liparis tanakae]|uniref:Uncharacterized protein n=1 Tax=Liparis tanakae TaxID=230148 RepID=A0A4Z2EFL5_9TELE|nr:hypothetical protein EYF80_062126 [Liparis tanakae]
MGGGRVEVERWSLNHLRLQQQMETGPGETMRRCITTKAGCLLLLFLQCAAGRSVNSPSFFTSTTSSS